MTNNRPNIISSINPQTKIEAIILAQPEVIQGLLWGNPSFGHPEKNIATHVVDVLERIDALNLAEVDLRRLRLAALTHDTFKYRENKLYAGHCHGKLARNFMQQYTDDAFLLDLLEYHDEAYHSWQMAFCHNDVVLAEKRSKALIQRFGADINLYFQFFICDSSTGDKKKHPMAWFERKIAESIKN